MEKIMFVAFSHTLTEEQIQDAKAYLGVTRIVTLKEVNPELQALFSQVPPEATLEDTKNIASNVVEEAIRVKTDVFFCTGEFAVMLWANLKAKDTEHNVYFIKGEKYSPKKMRCVMSTTERKSEEISLPDGTVKKTQVFKHVQWRDLF